VKRVLLTGATGFIGRQTIDALLERGFEIHAVSREMQQDDRVTWHTVDLFDPDAVYALAADEKATHLLHLAWVTTPGEYWQSSDNEIWNSASNRLVATFHENGGEHAVLAGTCAEYDWSDGHCIEEETALRPESPYSAAKLAFRQRAFEIAHDTQLRISWSRIFFLFGAGEHPDRFVPSIVLPLLRGERAECTDGGQVRDYLDVRDVADALVAVLDSDYHGDVNIASGQAVPLKEIITAIGEELDAVDRIDFGARERRANEPPRIAADTSILNNVIGWQPQHELQSAIGDTVAWWRDNA